VAITIGARIHVHGVEHVRKDKSYVYMANHSSLIDTPALFAYLPYQFKIMAKKELFYVPFMGWHLWTSGNFPVDRGDARRTASSVRRVIEGVGAGKSLAVFPEVRTPDGRLQVQAGDIQDCSSCGRAHRASDDSRYVQLLPKTTRASSGGGRVHWHASATTFSDRACRR
jgi:1-acyl-sn-glycerol-3-phosphate acyltransferase